MNVGKRSTQDARLLLLTPANPWLRKLTDIWRDLFGDSNLPNKSAKRLNSTDDVETKQVRGKHIVHAFKRPFDAHTETMQLPRQEAGLHYQALSLAIQHLSPVPPNDVVVSADSLATPSTQMSTYRLGFVRRDLIERLETQYNELGARSVRFVVDLDDSELPLFTAEQRRSHLQSRWTKNGLTALVFALPFIAAFWAQNTLDQKLARLQAEEITLRRQVIASIDAEKELGRARATLSARPAERRPGKALEEMASLTKITPTSAWWQRFSWRPNDLYITLRSNDELLSTVREMRETQDRYTLRLVSDVTSTSSGQSVRLNLIPKSEPTRDGEAQNVDPT